MPKSHQWAHLLISPRAHQPRVVIPVSPQAKTGIQRKKVSLAPGHLLRKSRDDDKLMLRILRRHETGPLMAFGHRG
jgi:hypothetical protein